VKHPILCRFQEIKKHSLHIEYCEHLKPGVPKLIALGLWIDIVGDAVRSPVSEKSPSSISEEIKIDILIPILNLLINKGKGMERMGRKKEEPIRAEHPTNLRENSQPISMINHVKPIVRKKNQIVALLQLGAEISRITQLKYLWPTLLELLTARFDHLGQVVDSTIGAASRKKIACCAASSDTKIQNFRFSNS
jgi:hypothetical protein